MPKKLKYPRLRVHVRKGANGQRWVYYAYNMRPDGEKDIPLGSDYAAAIERWDELHNHKPQARGRLQEAINRWKAEVLPTYTNKETRKSYGKQLSNVEAVLGQMTWDAVTLPILREYLERRKAPTQGNREMSVLSIVWSKARIWGMTQLQWPAAGVKSWKMPEQAREFEVTDELFSAVYAEADQVLRDAMDIATATGMRLTDVRTVAMPSGDVVSMKASKTGKRADFQIQPGSVLEQVLDRRRQVRADHLMLLSTPSGRVVSAGMLRDRWDAARARAAKAHPKLKKQIEAMYLRDMRKRASDLADTMQDASDMLQHSDRRITEKHYRQKATKLRTVR